MKVTNIKIAGLGGMGVLSAANVLAQAAFDAGFQVKKAEVHGMSQRGGSVASDIRFGKEVFSPMIPVGEVDFLLCLAPEWKELHQKELAPGGKLLCVDQMDLDQLPNKKAANVALMGMLSRHLPMEEAVWQRALEKAFAPKLHEANWKAFQWGRQTA